MNTLHIPAVIKTVPVTLKPLSGKKVSRADWEAIKAVFPASADTILEKAQALLDTRAFFSSTEEAVGDARLSSNGKSVAVGRVIEVSPAGQIQVADAKAAAQVLQARLGQPVLMQEGGKRARMTADGQVITCGTAVPFSAEQIEASVPVVALFTTQRGQIVGKLV